MPIKPIPLSVCGLYILRALSLHAAEIPDSGQSLRESQTKPVPLPAPTVTPILRIDDKTSLRRSDSNERINVQSFRITGNTVFTENELSTLVTHLIGAPHTLAELEAGAAQITAHYRERGYIVARAYLPAQEIQSGVITIAVLEGRINQVVINNKTSLSDARIASYISKISKDTLIKAEPIDRALLLLTDTPGVDTPKATLKPGVSVGTSDLTIDIDSGVLYDGRISMDNYGNRYTGQYRLNGLLNLNSLLKLGDQLSMNAIQSDKDLSYGRIAWQLPVGGNGLTLGAAYAYTTYQLGEEFSTLDAHGHAKIASLIATYPFLRTPATNVSGTFLLDSRRLHDRVDSINSVSDKRVKRISLGLNGTHQNRLGNANLFELTLSHGRLSIDTDAAVAVDAASTRANGEYTTAIYTFSRLHRINQRNSLIASFSGQWANKNLGASLNSL